MTLWRLFLTAVAAFIILSFVILLITNRLIHKPVALLIDGTNDIKNGNYKKQINYQGNTEFAFLADSFNEMSEKLRIGRNQLEERIQERTIELKTSNEQLAREIVEHSKAEEALRKSEESKRQLLHAAGDGILGVDVTGKLTFVNPAALRILGYTEQEILGQTGKMVHDLIHHSHADGSKYLIDDCPMRASFAHGTDHYITDELLWRKDGSSFPAEYSSMPIIQDGKIMGAVVTFKDITERKQAEEEIKRNQLITELYANEISIIAEIGRVVGNTLNINQVFEKIDKEVRKLIDYDRLVVNLKKDDNEFITTYASGVDNAGRKSDNVYLSNGTTTRVVMTTRKGIIVQPTDPEEIKDLYPNLYATFKKGLRSAMSVPLISMGEVIGALTFRSLKLKSYTEQDLHLAERIGAQIAPAIANAQLFKNLTEAEKSLRESEDRFRLLAENARDAIWTMDLNLQITYVSPYVKRLLDYTPEEYMVMPLNEVLTRVSLERCMRLLAEQLEIEKKSDKDPLRSNTIEVEHISKNGDIVPAEIKMTFIRNPAGQAIGILGYTNDITERKRAEEALIEEHKRLQKALDEVRTLRGIVPICSYCKKIRDDEGYWNQVEKYVGDHTDAKFSHAICPACFEREMKGIQGES